jgi:hypothetical protein
MQVVGVVCDWNTRLQKSYLIHGKHDRCVFFTRYINESCACSLWLKYITPMSCLVREHERKSIVCDSSNIQN